ncbi:hypothetical protein AB0L06_31960 [Spirillospora sp. NPDC052269]
MSIKRIVITTAALTLTGGTLAAPAEAGTAKPVPGWRIVHRVANKDVLLRDVKAGGPRNLWTAGETYGTIDHPSTPVALHWNGAKWASLSPRADQVTRLTTIATSSTGDTWAFGPLMGVDKPERALHWNGKAWTAGGLPGDYTWITTAATFGPRDVWALGRVGGQNGEPYIAHFNGKRWTKVAAPKNVTSGSINNVVGISPKNLWAVVAEPFGFAVIHYDGRAWRSMPMPTTVDNPYQSFAGGGLVARGSHDVWVAGRFPTAKGTGAPGLAHYDGKKWTVVTAPGASTPLAGLADDGHGGLWATTLYSPSEIWHYSKGHWTKATPKGGVAKPYLSGMTHLPHTTTSVSVGDENGPAVLATGAF